MAGWFGAQEMVTGQVLMIDEVVRRVDAVTLEDVRRVTDTLLRTEKLSLTVVGPTRARKTAGVPAQNPVLNYMPFIPGLLS